MASNYRRTNIAFFLVLTGCVGINAEKKDAKLDFSGSNEVQATLDGRFSSFLLPTRNLDADVTFEDIPLISMRVSLKSSDDPALTDILLQTELSGVEQKLSVVGTCQFLQSQDNYYSCSFEGDGGNLKLQLVSKSVIKLTWPKRNHMFLDNMSNEQSTFSIVSKYNDTELDFNLIN